MQSESSCAECGARLIGGAACQDHFHQLLFWEAEFPELGSVHHLTVLCYHLQHPSLYSPQGLRHARGLLVEFLEAGHTPQEVRLRRREQVDSGRREWKVTARQGARGAYAHPVAWTITIGDVLENGPEAYIHSVQAWAEALLDDLRASGNLE